MNKVVITFIDGLNFSLSVCHKTCSFIIYLQHLLSYISLTKLIKPEKLSGQIISMFSMGLWGLTAKSLQIFYVVKVIFWFDWDWGAEA